MPRGYRIAILAAFGWLSLAANESGVAPSGVSNNQTTSERATSPKTPQPASQTVTAPKANETESQDAGCPNGQDRRDSDLCAQWKAADAAFDAARAAEATLRIGWLGLALGAVTMFAAIAAALYAREASKAARQTADDARIIGGPSIDVTANVMLFRENRTYNDGFESRIVVQFVNNGSSTARQLIVEKCQVHFDGLILECDVRSVFFIENIIGNGGKGSVVFKLPDLREAKKPNDNFDSAVIEWACDTVFGTEMTGTALIVGNTEKIMGGYMIQMAPSP